MTVNTYYLSADGNRQLSAHFKVREFACPGNDLIKIDDKLCPTMEKIFAKYRCSKAVVNSGYRTDSYSVSVGGYAGDQHTKGKACDVTFYGGDGRPINHKNVCCDLQDLGVPGVGYISQSAVHLDFRAIGVWRGDEKSGNRVSDFYTYFGISRQPSQTIIGKKLYLPSSATSWRVYPTNVPTTRGNEIGYLNPSKFGGLSYDVFGNPQKDVYTIRTSDFGLVNIYAAPMTGAVVV